MSESLAPPPAAVPPQARGRRTMLFAAAMVVVLGAFVWLSSLQGPPPMPPDETHMPLKTDRSCLTCHDFADRIAAGQALPKPLKPSHPPARPKKRRAGTDAGPAPETPELECIKCHAPE